MIYKKIACLSGPDILYLNCNRFVKLYWRNAVLNSLLHAITEQGLNHTLYNIFFAAGFAAVLFFNLLNAKNFRIPRLRAVILTVLVYVVSTFWMMVLCWIENGFRNFGANNIVRVFIWVPVFTWPVSKLLKLDFKTCCDYLAPCLCVVHGVAHFGCIFEGCCRSYRWKYGIFNPQLGVNTFPIQPIEALIAVAIVILIWVRQKKNQFRVDGLSFPIMLMLFGYSRFFLEFARDNEKLFLGISGLAIHALVMALVGTAWYAAAAESNRKHRSRAKKKA